MSEKTICPFCKGLHPTNSMRYSPTHDFRYCTDCREDTSIGIDCNVCRKERPLTWYDSNSYSCGQNTIEILKNVDENYNIICHRCVQYMYIKCARCLDINILDITSDTIGMDNRETALPTMMSIKSYIREKDYGVFDGSTLCTKCFNHMSMEISASPPKSLPSDYFKSSTFDKLDIKRFIGIENETIYDEVPDDFEDGGDDYEDYIDVPLGWRAVYDGSLSYGGVELKTSRPVQGDKLLQCIERLTNSYNYQDVFVDYTCGLHIHFDARDIGVREMVNMLYVIKAIEGTIIDSMVSYRKENRYCRTMNKIKYSDLNKIETMGQLCKMWYDNLSKENMTMTHYNESRYHGFNLHSRFYMGTIEFRYHEGVLGRDDIIDWIKFCKNIINASLVMSSNNLPRKFTKYRNKLIDTFIKDKGIKTTPLERIKLIGGEDSAQYIERRINKQTE